MCYVCVCMCVCVYVYVCGCVTFMYRYLECPGFTLLGCLIVIHHPDGLEELPLIGLHAACTKFVYVYKHSVRKLELCH